MLHETWKKLLITLTCLPLLGCLLGCDNAPTFSFLPVISDLWSDEADADKTPNSPNLTAQKTETIGEAQVKPQFQIEADALDGNIIPDAAITSEWTAEGAQFSGNIKGSSLNQVVDKATIGEGYNWSANAIAASAIIAGDVAIAMDGRGYISAHNINDFSEQLWLSEAINSDDDIVTGGLAISEGVVYAITSHGNLSAINAKNGKLIWRKNLEEPIRSSVHLQQNKLMVVTADGQLLCFEKQTGAALWQHRAVAQNSGVFSTAMATSNQTSTVVAFPSGDLSSINTQTGAMLWSDSLQKMDINGKASALFSGVDANPILENNLLISGNLADLTIAHDATTGARIWELPVGIMHHPWIAGDALFAITSHGEMIAVHKYRGAMAWQKVIGSSKFAKDKAKRYHGTFLLNGQLVAIAQTGEVFAFSPQTGKKLWVRELGYEIAASPAFSGKNALLVTNDAQLLIVK